MRFCCCGKLMTRTDFGFECVCGAKTDEEGNALTDGDGRKMVDEAARIAAIKAKYHSKYPNMSDPLVRVTRPEYESETEDETFSDVLRPSAKKRREGNFSVENAYKASPPCARIQE